MPMPQIIETPSASETSRARRNDPLLEVLGCMIVPSPQWLPRRGLESRVQRYGERYNPGKRVENYGARAAARALRPLRTTATPWRTTSRPRSSDDAARGSRSQRDAERAGSRTAPPTPGRWLFRQRTRLLGLVTDVTGVADAIEQLER